MIIKSIGLGFGLAMDAFSLSLANGLNEPNMKVRKQLRIALTFGFFQYMMPMIGYVFVSYLSKVFVVIKKFLPYVSCGLLCYIGIKLVIDGVSEIKKIRANEDGSLQSDEINFDVKNLTLKMLIIQAIVTSIDALSVGFTMSDYDLLSANISTIIIGITTFIICMAGVQIGKFFGLKFKAPALLAGGTVLIIIGITIFFR